jgi:nucleoside-diphosphate-sugar epimerase
VVTCDPLDPDAVFFDALKLFRYDGPDKHEVFDLVVHCAATAPHRVAIDTMPMNLVEDLLLDAAMFEWAVRTGQKHVVYMSSSAAYPVRLQRKGIRMQLDEELIDPAHPEQGDAAYGFTKLGGERMAHVARLAGVQVTVVRPFSGYGEDQGEKWPFGAFVARAMRREDPFTIWGDASQVRDWIHIDDVVKGILALVDAGVVEPVNLCTGVGTSMQEMVARICAAAGYSPEISVDAGAPQGVHHRVGNPDLLHRTYVPEVSVGEGIARAIAARGK